MYVTHEIVINPNSLAREWTELEQNSDCKFFLTWHWIKPWLELIKEYTDVYLLRIRHNNKTIGLCTYIGIDRRKYFYKSSAIYINELPVNPYNMVIEYNGALLRKGFEREATVAIVSWFTDHYKDWNEINFNAIDIKSEFYKNVNELMENNYDVFLIKKDKVNIFTNLNLISKIGDNLSSNRRYQIRRAIRMYENLYSSSISFSVAANRNEALIYFNKMGLLHTNYWKKKNKSGSFSNSKWVNFHKNIINSFRSRDFIRLIKLSCADYTIGYLYNILWRNEMINIQSGFNYDEDPKYKPGYITHYYAMNYAKDCGCNSYNFLAGNAQYKRSLSNHQDNLVWLRIRRPLLKYKVDKMLRIACKPMIELYKKYS